MDGSQFDLLKQVYLCCRNFTVLNLDWEPVGELIRYGEDTVDYVLYHTDYRTVYVKGRDRGEFDRDYIVC